MFLERKNETDGLCFVAAPEVLNYEPIRLATDMWYVCALFNDAIMSRAEQLMSDFLCCFLSNRSVGVLAYVLLTGCTPFGGDSKQETFCNITRCQLEFPDDLFHDVSPAAIQFISSLLVQDPRYKTIVCCNQRTFFLNLFVCVNAQCPVNGQAVSGTPVAAGRIVCRFDSDGRFIFRGLVSCFPEQYHRSRR